MAPNWHDFMKPDDRRELFRQRSAKAMIEKSSGIEISLQKMVERRNRLGLGLTID